ncbi:MAG: phosphotransferase [Acidimicrobiales bacterium]
MEPAELNRAIDAATSIAAALGLPADDAVVLQNSNKLSLRLLPCDVFARIASADSRSQLLFEIDLARRLAAAGSPVAALEPRVDPRCYERDGAAITLWTYYEPAAPDVAPAAYADALGHLHTGMRSVDLPTPHAIDRVDEALQIVGSASDSPGLGDADRALLADTLRRVRRTILGHRAVEQLLHGEPHPGNVLSTEHGPLFVDLETCCRGPVEFDLAHAPASVVEHYPGIDHALLSDCRELVLAMVAAWRWEPGDQLPNGAAFGRALLSALRAGPPWPTIDEVHGRLP